MGLLMFREVKLGFVTRMFKKAPRLRQLTTKQIPPASPTPFFKGGLYSSLPLKKGGLGRDF